MLAIHRGEGIRKDACNPNAKRKNDAGALFIGNELKEYLREKAKTHNSYKYYAKIDYVKQIVRDKVLYLNNGAEWNDITDRGNLANGSEDSVLFGKCFSYSQDESIAMWMLYGGIYHQGAMIDFTRKGMAGVLEIPEITLGSFKDGRFCPLVTLQRPDFEVYITDIVYCDEKKRYLKRSNESCIHVPKATLEQLGCCQKAYPWHYENECRLIVSVKKELVPDSCHSVLLDLQGLDLGTSLERVYYSPEYKGAEEEGFRKSPLTDTVHFDLLTN